jgi:UDP-glucose 4-epimerase
MQPLVIGGKGFIGSAVVRLLGECRTYDLVDGQDVHDLDALDKAIADSNVVFDCAGVLGSAETFDYVRETIKANIYGVLNVLDVCQRHDVPMVFMSLKNDWNNPYMISKHAATRFCQMYHEYHGLRTTVVRGLNAYGPGQHWGKVRKVVPTFIIQALHNEPLKLYGDGRQIVDLIYVDDLAEIMVRVEQCEVWGEVLDGGTGVPMTVRDLARAIIEVTGSDSAIEYLPMRKGEPQQAVALADPTLARQLLDFYPTRNLYDGLWETVEWYRQHWEEMRR